MSRVVTPRTDLRCTLCPRFDAFHSVRGLLSGAQSLRDGHDNSVITVEQLGVMQALCPSHAVMLLGADWREQYDIPEYAEAVRGQES